MAYQRGQNSIREVYEEHFSSMDSREVTVHRVVNIVDRRSPIPRSHVEFDRGFNNEQWYGGPRNYHDTREFHGENSYPPNDRRYSDDNSHGNFHRNVSQKEGPYPQQSYGRDDLRHQLASRSRSDPYFRSRGRVSGPPRRNSPSAVVKQDRSPGRREAHPPVRSGSNTSNRSFSPDREKGFAYQPAQERHKPSGPRIPSPRSTVEEPPHSSGSSKANPAFEGNSNHDGSSKKHVAEKTPASGEETKEAEEAEEVEEEVAASMEPKLTPEQDFKARRSEAIKAKALEIEKHYRKDCETFRTVVKMLVAKEPSLDKLLQGPLDENLLEINERCLDALRHFVKELDEVLKQPDASA
ncbi:periphilin-1-like [Cyclopterus lumpus]|uniref:Periphilin 1 n=1 Tax=Cyclopterus lumpus TaxID=8103 RepID=A0A8C2YVD0_CYCLU|nr:periphilin-1-like [Cyclopterus lumpus]